MKNRSGNNDGRVALKDGENNPVSANFPLQVDGDSIYSKDINVALSNIGGFSGDILTLFNDYETEIVDATANNPKTVIIHLLRPIKSNQIGIGSKTGDFSNVKISLKDLAGTVRTVIDDSANSTKYSSNVYAFTTNVFIEIVVEFYTADTVTLSGMYVPKVQSRAISAIDGFVSAKNSSLAPLGAGGTFAGAAENSKDYGAIQVALYSDQSCTFNIYAKSTSTSTWRLLDTYEVAAGEDKTWSFQGARQFVKTEVINGPVAQGVGGMDLQTMFKPVYTKPSSHPLGGIVKSNDDGELVIAQVTAEKPDLTYTNIQASASGNLKIANAEDNLNIAQGNVVGISSVHKFGRGSNIDTADGFVVLWDGAGYNDALKDYTYSTTADIDRLSSDDNGDVVDIEITGLDANWDEVVQTITLTGQTPAVLTTSLIRIYRMINMGATDVAGNVFCFVNVATTLGVPDTITNTRAMIIDGNNQTLMALYSVPRAKTGYIEAWYGALSSAKASSFNNLEMRARPFGGIFQLKHTSTLSSAGTSHIQHLFVVPAEFPAKTDFVMLSDSSVNDNAVSAGFDFVLIDD